jgi:thiol-disulfide isomerase/thioredoxin
MNEKHHQPTVGQAIEEYYAASSLPQAKLQRLMKKRPFREHWYWMAGGALASAAALVVLALAFGYGGGVSRPNTQVMVEASTPSLVAVQIHADWCSRSPVVAPIFADLLTQYGNEPVLFVTLDITDDVRRGQAELLAESLGIPQAFDQPFIGMIKLIDRESNTLLASISGREESAEFEVRLAEFLDAAKHNRPGDET